jgi:hypothetical protein
MIIYKSNSVEVKKIDFCCETMARNVLLGIIKPYTWTDHPLIFYINDENNHFSIRHCPNCGSKIETKFLLEADEPRVD